MHTVWYYTVLFHLNSSCKHNKDDRVKHMQDVKDERDRMRRKNSVREHAKQAQGANKPEQEEQR